MPAITCWERDLVARESTETTIRMASGPDAPWLARQHVRSQLPADLSAGRLCDLVLLTSELSELGRAFEIVTHTALPAAERALAAAKETYRVGKGDMLSVLVSRRDFSALSLRRLEILDKSWQLLGDLVEITGELP